MNKGFLIIDAMNNVVYIPAKEYYVVSRLLMENGIGLDTVEQCHVKSGVRLAVARYLKAKTEEEYYELKNKEEHND